MAHYDIIDNRPDIFLLNPREWQVELNTNPYVPERITQIKKAEQVEQNKLNVRIDNSKYEQCSICLDILDNIHGPGSTDNCKDNGNDVVIACTNRDMFHRGCILDWCNAPSVDTAAQMGSTYSNVKQQEKSNNCPLCREDLLKKCNEFNKIPKIPENQLPLKNGGGKRHSKTRKISNRKSSKFGKNDKRISKSKRKNRKNRNNTRRNK